MFHRAHRICAVLQNIGPEHTQMQSFTLKQWMYLWNSTSVCGFSNVVAFLLAAQLFFFFFLWLGCWYAAITIGRHHVFQSGAPSKGFIYQLIFKGLASKLYHPDLLIVLHHSCFLLCCLINGCILFGFFCLLFYRVDEFKAMRDGAQFGVECNRTVTCTPLQGKSVSKSCGMQPLCVFFCQPRTGDEMYQIQQHRTPQPPPPSFPLRLRLTISKALEGLHVPGSKSTWCSASSSRPEDCSDTNETQGETWTFCDRVPPIGIVITESPLLKNKTKTKQQ